MKVMLVIILFREFLSWCSWSSYVGESVFASWWMFYSS